MPHDLPDWQLVYHYFDLWKKDGTWKKLNDTLRVKVRKKAGREAEPTASILDSQSVKTTEEAQTKGYDAGKKVKDRKRHLLVDTLGLVLLCGCRRRMFRTGMQPRLPPQCGSSPRGNCAP